MRNNDHELCVTSLGLISWRTSVQILVLKISSGHQELLRPFSGSPSGCQKQGRRERVQHLPFFSLVLVSHQTPSGRSGTQWALSAWSLPHHFFLPLFFSIFSPLSERSEPRSPLSDFSALLPSLRVPSSVDEVVGWDWPHLPISSCSPILVVMLEIQAFRSSCTKIIIIIIRIGIFIP